LRLSFRESFLYISINLLVGGKMANITKYEREDPVFIQTLRTQNARLKLRRAEYKLSQVQLAELADVPVHAIREFENLRKIPETEKEIVYASKIAESLETRVEYLFPGLLKLFAESGIEPKQQRLITQKQIEDYQQRELERLNKDNNPEIKLIGPELRAEVLNKLKGRELCVIDFYYGLGLTDLYKQYRGQKTLAEIGNIFGISASRAQQIKSRALARLRYAPRVKALLSYLQ